MHNIEYATIMKFRTDLEVVIQFFCLILAQ